MPSNFAKPSRAAVALLAMALALAGVVPVAVADHLDPPTSAALAGSFQSELGCPGDWQPDCADTELAYDAANEVWKATYTLPAGDWEYKVALDDTWDVSYPAGNVTLSLAAETDVTFYYLDASHWVADTVNDTIATVAGSFQSEIGCPGDWQPECLLSLMDDVDGDGVLSYEVTGLPVGDYEFKVALDEAWNTSYPGGNVPFAVAADTDTVTVTFDPVTTNVAVEVDDGGPGGEFPEPPTNEELALPSLRDDLDDEVFYFVLPDRFHNGDPSNDCGDFAGTCDTAQALTHGFDPTDEGFYHGGDLAGLLDKIDYIEDLGATAIWMAPMFKNKPVQGSGDDISAGYHGYWTIDYTQIDPHFGTNEELGALIDEAHARGIKVFFDIVTNHTADVIRYEEGTYTYVPKADEPFRDADGDPFDDRDFAGTDTFPSLDPAISFPYTPTFETPEDESVKVPAWLNDPTLYHNRGNSSFAGENSVYGDFFGLDDLFTARPDVVDGMVDIFEFWTSEYEVDGFRIDTVKHVNIEFWQQWVPAILDHTTNTVGNDDFFMFGEVFSADPSFLSIFPTTTDMQAVLDFGFQASATDFAARSAPTSQLAAFFAADDWFTDADSNAYSMPTFLGNHDMGRIGTFISGANSGADDAELLARDVLAHALMYAARGMPVIYSGDEQGFTGSGGDKAARQDLDPSQTPIYLDDDQIGTDATPADDNFDQTHPLYTTLGDLSGLTQAHEALRSGAQLQRYAQDSAGVFAFSRVLRDELVEYLVVANNAEGDASASIPTGTPGATFSPLWSSAGSVPALVAGGDGAVDVTAAPLSLSVYVADAPMPTGAAAPGVTVGEIGRFDVDKDGHEQHGIVLEAEVGSDAFAEVTFAVSVGGADWEVAGTDDNAPYRVHFRTDAPGGTPVAVKAVVRDAAGNLSSDVTEGVVPGGPDGPGGECSVATAVVHYNRPDLAYDDWTLWSFFDIDEPGMVGAVWPNGLEWDGDDDFGVFRTLDLLPGAEQVGVIVVDGAGNKDGTDADRIFDPRVTPEVWINAGDPTTYTSQAAAQGYVTIHYQRPGGDYGDPTSNDFNDFWGLHLWGDALAEGVATEWTSPRKPDGIDDYGAFWNVPVDDVDADLNFIIHRGDEKDPGPDMSVVPSDDGGIWIQSGEEEIHATEASATDTVVLHYQRPGGDYGDWTSDDFNDFWGVHTWTGADPPNPGWTEPYKGVGVDRWGAVYEIPVTEDATELAFILHRGDEKDLPDDQFLDIAGLGHEVWFESGRADANGQYDYVVPVSGCDGPGEGGSLNTESAHWLTTDTIAWEVDADDAGTYTLHAAAGGGLSLVDGGVVAGGDDTVLEWVSDTLPTELAEQFPHLAGYDVLRVPAGVDVPAVLTGQLAVSVVVDGVRLDATGLQLPGVIDQLYATDAPLGPTWDGGTPTISLWAPTAKDVELLRYSAGDQDPASPDAVVAMTRDDATGVWTATGDPSWAGAYYLFRVEVYAPSTGAVETNLVTDPYSLSLATNSAKSLVVDLADTALQPAGWDAVGTSAPATPEEMALYELHVRDFSISDETVPEELRGTYAAFTVEDSDGMQHLRSLAEAGVTTVHLLPTFDIATIEERRSEQLEPDPAPFDDLDQFPPDSEEQQARVLAVADQDGFNWGYDPYHYTTPEGSYSTDPMGTQRIVEYREMVQSLNGTGLGVVMDVVYNHTAQAGQADKSVLDRIVPGYYHRLLADGAIATSTCCQNTAPEHAMMGRLVVDSIVTWAREYKVDGFRFDLMGHHPKQNMLDVRAALDGLTLEEDGVDGSRIYVYGEGWNFGEVADDARFVQATQLNMGGTGIGVFNDRLRDAVRGGGPFDEDQRVNQGFASGLWTDPNALNDGGEDELAELLLSADQIRVGLAGNLADYAFVDRTGTTVTGSQVDYNGSPVGYTQDPQEDITYVSAHDNETLFDSNVFKLPTDSSMDTRVRMQALGTSTVLYGQGVPFLHAGIELLRSKSLDRNSYNSGDHFNEVDWTYQSNNFGVGLPPAPDNEDKWDDMRPLLADPANAADADAITATYARVAEQLRVQRSSPLFSLQTAADVQDKVAFLNTGAGQVPGLIAMHLDDTIGDDVDAARERLVVFFNATPDPIEFTVDALTGAPVRLHPELAASDDAVTASASFDPATGTFTIPARTASVFEQLTPVDVSDALDGGRSRIVEGAGNVRVTLLTTDALDATTIDRATIAFGPAGAAPRRCVEEDVGGDGRADLACQFRVSETGLTADDTTAVFTALTTDLVPVVGTVPVDVKRRGGPRGR